MANPEKGTHRLTIVPESHETDTTVDPVISEEIRTLEAMYYKYRPSNATPLATTQMMTRMVLAAQEAGKWPYGGDYKEWPVTTTHVEKYGWEASYREREVKAVLAMPGLQPLQRLRDLQEVRAHAKDVLSASAQELRGDAEGDVPSAAATERYNKLWKHFLEIEKEIAELADVVRKEEMERSGARASKEWRERRETLYQNFLEQYDSLGPVYETLCAQLADVRVRIEQSQVSGRNVPIEEFTKMNQAQIQIIGQLQKYTEATKSESISKEAQELAKHILEIVEQEIAQESPHLWQRIVQALRKKITAVA